jgi:hypothetical protein
VPGARKVREPSRALAQLLQITGGIEETTFLIYHPIAEKSEHIACASRLKGGGHKKNNRKQVERAEEEVRHKRYLT